MLLRKPAGYICIVDPEAPTIEFDTFQCCHCDGHHVVKPGSGNVHGWCTRCMAAVCSNGECIKHCTPFEQRLDLYEKGKTLVL